MIFTDFSEKDRRDIIDYVSAQSGFDNAIIEKDWWVTTVLRVLFNLPYASDLSFKGGTSLSKCWKLISRMSEDIDIAINREYLGFSGSLSKNQISDKLRRAACSFVRNDMQNDIRNGLISLGIRENLFKVWVNITSVSTTDPEVIFIEYPSISAYSDYIAPRVKIEVSGRSMSEPIKQSAIKSYIAEHFSSPMLEEKETVVNAVLPHRTFLEKLFLVHEEFAKPGSEIRVERMSRHLYDIDQILDTPIAEEALRNNELYDSIIEHRRKFIGLRGFDYDTLHKETLCIIPKGDIKEKWRKDYEQTVRSMVLGKTHTFDEVMHRLDKLNYSINHMS